MKSCQQLKILHFYSFKTNTQLIRSIDRNRHNQKDFLDILPMYLLQIHFIVTIVK